MYNKNQYSRKIFDPRSGRDIDVENISKMKGYGWVNFQDSEHTAANRQLILDGVETPLTYTSPFLFEQTQYAPQNDAVPLTLWNETTQRLAPFVLNSVYNVRITIFAQATTAATGSYVDIAVRVPNGIAVFEDSKPLVKGTGVQRIVVNAKFYIDQPAIDNGLDFTIQGHGTNLNIYNKSLLIES